MIEDPGTARFSADTLRDFTRRVLVAAGANPGAAEVCAEVLVHADLAGADTHGIARLNQYARALTSGLVSGRAEPEVVSDRGAAITVDAHNALGPVGLRFATDLAAAAARTHGVAVVAVRGSNHAGAMAWYTERAADAGAFAVVLSGSTKAMVAPTHGAAPFLGTNAVAYAVRAGDQAVSFDAATSVASRSRLEAHQREGRKLPEGWAIGPDGLPAVDPGEVIDGIDALSGYSLLPFGGPDGEHKGYGISLLVELLCGPLAGARWGPTVPGAGPAGVGHLVLCLHLSAFGDASAAEDRIAALCAGLAAARPAAGEPVRLPGDRRRRVAERFSREGIPVPGVVLVELDRVAQALGVPALPRGAAAAG